MMRRVLQRAWREVQLRRDPVAYARSIGVRIGERCRIYSPSIEMWGSDPYLICIGNNVHITHECMFVTHDGATLILRHLVPDLELSAPIVVGDDVYFGFRALVLPGVRIGNRCIIGAGAIVTRDVPDNSVAVGVPARVVKSVDEFQRSAEARSLHLGHLQGPEKENALRRHFHLPGDER